MGDARPKQFCPVLGVETLLERTRRRAARAIPPPRTLVALTRSHQRFYQPLIAGMPPQCALVQPQERGTAPAILYGLLRIPAPALAQALLGRGCLWSTFVMVARVPALLALIRQAAPDLAAAFSPLRAALGTPGEAAAVRAVYAGLASSSFAGAVLATRPANLAVLPVSGVEWSDWGRPARVLATLAGLGIRPAWADRLELTA